MSLDTSSENLCKLLEGDYPATIREKLGDAKAAEIFVEMIEIFSPEIIHAALWEKDSYVYVDLGYKMRDLAVEEFVNIKSKKAVKPLINLLNSESDLFAIDALGNLGDKRAIRPLFNELLESSDPETGDYDGSNRTNHIYDNIMKFADKRDSSFIFKYISNYHKTDFSWIIRHPHLDLDNLFKNLYDGKEFSTIKPPGLITIGSDGIFNSRHESDYMFEDGCKICSTRYDILRAEKRNILTKEGYVVEILEELGWKPQNDRERIAYCAALFSQPLPYRRDIDKFTDMIVEWGIEAIEPLIDESTEVNHIFLSGALTILANELIQDNRERINVLKFLKTNNKATIILGASMLKGILEEGNL